MSTSPSNKNPDLSQRPPRSPRVRLGGYVMLARVLDKARASVAGTCGAYKYGNPLDQLLFQFAGISGDALLDQVKTGVGDWEILQWVNANSTTKPAAYEIAAWSQWMENLTAGEVGLAEWFLGQIQAIHPNRTDLNTLFEYLDVDDYVEFGGVA